MRDTLADTTCQNVYFAPLHPPLSILVHYVMSNRSVREKMFNFKFKVDYKSVHFLQSIYIWFNLEGKPNKMRKLVGTV